MYGFFECIYEDMYACGVCLCPCSYVYTCRACTAEIDFPPGLFGVRRGQRKRCRTRRATHRGILGRASVHTQTYDKQSSASQQHLNAYFERFLVHIHHACMKQCTLLCGTSCTHPIKMRVLHRNTNGCVSNCQMHDAVKICHGHDMLCRLLGIPGGSGRKRAHEGVASRGGADEGGLERPETRCMDSIYRLEIGMI